MIVESLSTVLILSVIVEVATNGVKAILPALKGENSRMVATVIGILLTITTGIGILENLNITINYQIIDYLLTGIVISRGSNAVHDIISIFDNQNTRII